MFDKASKVVNQKYNNSSFNVSMEAAAKANYLSNIQQEDPLLLPKGIKIAEIEKHKDEIVRNQLVLQGYEVEQKQIKGKSKEIINEIRAKLLKSFFIKQYNIIKESKIKRESIREVNQENTDKTVVFKVKKVKIAQPEPDSQKDKIENKYSFLLSGPIIGFSLLSIIFLIRKRKLIR